MPLLDRIDNSVERLGKRFSSLIDEGQGSGIDWGAAVGQQGQGQGINWAGALGQQPGGINWGAAVGQGQQGGDSLFSRYLSGYGSGGGPFNFSGFDMFHQAKNQRDMADAARGAATTGQNVSDVGVPGSDFGNPTPQQLDAELNGTALAGQGATIVAAAARRGVPVTALMAIMAQESSYRTPAAGTKNNFGGLKDPKTGGFADWNDTATGIDAVAANLGSGLYRGLTLAQVINKWAPASDGNDPNAYTNNALATIRRLGGNATANSVVVGAGQPTIKPPVSAQGTTFPVVGWGGQVQLHHGSDPGAADLFAAEGTPVAALANGTVQDASWNNLGGWTVTLKLDNGLLVYMAHLRDAPLVKAGQRVGAGAQLGYVGQTGNAQGTGSHLHIGIGYSIASGDGPHGGAGDNFDAVTYLQQILAGLNGAGGTQTRT